MKNGSKFRWTIRFVAGCRPPASGFPFSPRFPFPSPTRVLVSGIEAGKSPSFPFGISESRRFSLLAFSPPVPHTASQTFLRELDKKLWTAADKLRSNLDAAVYKHAVGRQSCDARPAPVPLATDLKTEFIQ